MQKTGSISFSVDLVPGKLEPLSLPVELINPSVILIALSNPNLSVKSSILFYLRKILSRFSCHKVHEIVIHIGRKPSLSLSDQLPDCD